MNPTAFPMLSISVFLWTTASALASHPVDLDILLVDAAGLPAVLATNEAARLPAKYEDLLETCTLTQPPQVAYSDGITPWTGHDQMLAQVTFGDLSVDNVPYAMGIGRYNYSHPNRVVDATHPFSFRESSLNIPFQVKNTGLRRIYYGHVIPGTSFQWARDYRPDPASIRHMTVLIRNAICP